jgi:hypothetical protein
MKKILLLGSLIIVALSGFASHLMGGQITATQISGLTYQVELTLYRDILGINVSNSETVHLKHTTTGNTYTTVGNHAGAVNLVNGVEEYLYVMAYTFPTTGLYEIRWSSCCRNAAIINSSQPGAEGMVLVNMLLVDTLTGNSSPVFLNPPVVLAQLGDTFYYNPLPFDIDGDSISWQVDTPISGYATLNYIAGYTAPFSGPGGAFTMNPLTGEITWIPNTIGHFVASFTIEEFRNSVKIGEIRRDMQYIVVDIPGNVNRAGINTSGWPVNASGNILFDLDINTPFILSVIASDGDGDDLWVEANGEPLLLTSNAATWSNLVTAPGLSENEFSWITTINEMRTNPYLVTFRIYETHGSYTLIRDQTIQLKVGDFTSVHETSTSFTIGNIYPVPSSGSLYFPVTVTKDSDLKLSFINQPGQEVKTFDKKLNAGQNVLYFENLNLPTGIYFINTIIDGEKQVKKIIIEK